MSKRQRLTEGEWAMVFDARCKSKRGEPVSAAERLLVEMAYASDAKRYAAMELDVFNATVPFGSAARAR